MKNIILLFAVLLALNSCAEPVDEIALTEKVTLVENVQLKTAYFASGCFWCVEAVFESVKGVEEAISGYSGGVIKNPTYAQICSGKLRHAEAVKVIYNPDVVSYSTLVDVFFNSHDPSTLNRQGPDSGPQYRSIAFYNTEKEKSILAKKVKDLKNEKIFSKITTEVVSFEVFYIAEEYHQDYERRNPNDSYVRAVSVPRLNAFKAKMPEILK
tara:strand:- start:27372 stop:28007 length:636 start_codon:yes stop_codon:yes gene_type:complete